MWSKLLRGLTIAALLFISSPPLAQMVQIVKPATPSLFRSSLNINLFPYPDYLFIDHIKYGSLGPVGLSFGSGSPIWNTDILDSRGWPKIKTDNTRRWGLGFQMPSGANFRGPYVLDDDGNGRGQVYFFGGGDFMTLDVSSVNCTQANLGRYNVTPGFRCVLYYDGPQAQANALSVDSNDPNTAGEYIQGLRFYRLEDEADLNAGKVYRRAALKILVDLNPSLLRFMTWTGGSSLQASRWENRLRVENSTWNGYTWMNSPPYGETTGSNQYSLASATGMPVAMTNGEVATFRVGTSIQKSGPKNLVSITRANPGVVTVNRSDTAVGSTSNGSDTITLTGSNPANDAAFIWPGQTVTGAGIPGGVTVVSKTSSTIVMSTGVGVTAGTGTTFTFTGHGFQTGDQVITNITSGMPELNLVPTTITVIDPVSYSIGIDTTAFAPFNLTGVGDSSNGSAVLTGFSSTADIVVGMTVSGAGIPAGRTVSAVGSTTVTLNSGTSVTAGTGTTFTFTGVGSSKQYITLNVGGRGAYPIIFANGLSQLSQFVTGSCVNSSTYWCAQNYYSLVFQSEMVASTTVNGVWAWVERGNAPSIQMQPTEIIAAFSREINALAEEYGRGPIHTWVTFPHMGVYSVDADYSAGSNPAIGMVDALLNGSVDWPPIPANTNLYVEFSNETWNSANGFNATTWLGRLGQLRYGGPVSDYASYSTIKTVVAMNDVKAAFPGDLSRLRFVLGGHGTSGVSGQNAARINGSAFYNADPWNPTPGVQPIQHFDHFAWAAYIFADTNYTSANLSGLVANWVAATTDPDRNVPIQSYVTDGLTNVITGGGETLGRYYGTLLAQYSALMITKGKTGIMYEGGWDARVLTIVYGNSISGGFTPATLTSGSDQITNLSAGTLSNLAVGNWLLGDGIPDLTKITAKGATSLTMSNNATTSIPNSKFYAMDDTNYFLWQVKRSPIWAAALIAAYNNFNTTPNVMLPADYIQTEIQWGHAFPDSYATTPVYGAGNPAGNLDPAFIEMGVRNRGTLPFLLKRDFDPASNDNTPMFLNRAA